MPLLDLVRSPRAGLALLARRGSPFPGLAPVLALGALYAAFSRLLHAGGHAPKVTLVPIPKEQYYLWQSLFIVPLFVALWLIYGLVAHALSRLAGGRASLGASLAVLGVAYAVPLACLFVIPDLIVYLAFGHAALAKAMRFYAPLAMIACVTLSALALMEAHQLSRPRAIAIALAGLVVQGALGGVLLR